MELYYSSNTCSMAEICHLEDQRYSDTLEIELDEQIKEATINSRKMLIANVAATQAKNKDLMKALRKHGFKRVGTYFGNTEMDVHVYVRGLKSVKAVK